MKIRRIILLLFISFLILPLGVSAQFGQAKNELTKVAANTGLNQDLDSTLTTVIKGVLSLVGTIFFALTVYAGFLWMTASGNEDRVTKAKDIVTQAVIGLAVTLSAYAITVFVTTKLN